MPQHDAFVPTRYRCSRNVPSLASKLSCTSARTRSFSSEEPALMRTWLALVSNVDCGVVYVANQVKLRYLSARSPVPIRFAEIDVCSIWCETLPNVALASRVIDWYGFTCSEATSG